MVFNTPNPISRIGYLKMGWHSAGRMPLWFSPGSLIPASFSKRGSIPSQYDLPQSLDRLGQNFSRPVSADEFQTPLTFDYLQWRYGQCPVAEYGMDCQKDSYGFVFRLKPLAGFIELRICEIWSKGDMNSNKQLTKSLKSLIRLIRPLMISCGTRLDLLFAFGPFAKGPEVTIRSVNMNSLTSFNQFSSWKPSIGSLELF
jgi:hypothetical protein